MGLDASVVRFIYFTRLENRIQEKVKTTTPKMTIAIASGYRTSRDAPFIIIPRTIFKK
jgi:hypothetical protein